MTKGEGESATVTFFCKGNFRDEKWMMTFFRPEFLGKGGFLVFRIFREKVGKDLSKIWKKFGMVLLELREILKFTFQFTNLEK